MKKFESTVRLTRGGAFWRGHIRNKDDLRETTWLLMIDFNTSVQYFFSILAEIYEEENDLELEI